MGATAPVLDTPPPRVCLSSPPLHINIGLPLTCLSCAATHCVVPNYPTSTRCMLTKLYCPIPAGHFRSLLSNSLPLDTGLPVVIGWGEGLGDGLPFSNKKIYLSQSLVMFPLRVLQTSLLLGLFSVGLTGLKSKRTKLLSRPVEGGTVHWQICCLLALL